MHVWSALCWPRISTNTMEFRWNANACISHARINLHIPCAADLRERIIYWNGVAWTKKKTLKRNAREIPAFSRVGSIFIYASCMPLVFAPALIKCIQIEFYNGICWAANTHTLTHYEHHQAKGRRTPKSANSFRSPALLAYRLPRRGIIIISDELHSNLLVDLVRQCVRVENGPNIFRTRRKKKWLTRRHSSLKLQ